MLNGGGGADETLTAVADLLRIGLPADQIVIWFRDAQTSRFRGVGAPAIKGEQHLADTPENHPTDSLGVRLSLVHEEAQLGLLEARPAPGLRQRELLAIVADLVSPFLA